MEKIEVVLLSDSMYVLCEAGMNSSARREREVGIKKGISLQ